MEGEGEGEVGAHGLPGRSQLLGGQERTERESELPVVTGAGGAGSGGIGGGGCT